QRALHGLEYLASYTLGKANANQLGYYGSGGFTASEGTYWMNAYDPELNYGPAFFDVRHNFVLSASFALPYGRDTQGASLANAVLGGWMVGGIFQARSRSEEHTSELQSRFDLVCRLLLEKKNAKTCRWGNGLRLAFPWTKCQDRGA